MVTLENVTLMELFGECTTMTTPSKLEVLRRVRRETSETVGHASQRLVKYYARNRSRFGHGRPSLRIRGHLYEPIY